MTEIQRLHYEITQSITSTLPLLKYPVFDFASHTFYCFIHKNNFRSYRYLICALCFADLSIIPLTRKTHFFLVTLLKNNEILSLISNQRTHPLLSDYQCYF